VKAWRPLATATLLALAGCGTSSATAADKTFVADMTPHHALGVRMADMALAKADDVRVREFGFTMARYQQAEFNQLSAMATSWKANPSGHAHGMLTPADEDALAALNGRAFDKAWLKQMIIHHEGAVAMATSEVATGSDAKAKAIAANVATVQTKEITKMKAVLAALST
jgi:uncharacterized protein (DUF305 family)